MHTITVTIDARPEVWGDAIEFVNAHERGSSPRSKIVAGKEHDPDELVPMAMRGEYHHREWRSIQEHTTPGKRYEVHWVHGEFIDASHSRGHHAHFESWFLIVDDTGHFRDVPAKLCQPADLESSGDLGGPGA